MSEKKKKEIKEDRSLGIAGVDKNPNPDWNNRVLIFTPTTGLVRTEWVNARYGQIIPCNWSNVNMNNLLLLMFQLNIS